jgi:hypothetical protein
MEKVFHVLGENMSNVSLTGKEYSKLSLVKGDAIVEKVLGPKRYVVILEDGTKLTVIGSESINKGAKVRVSSLSAFAFQQKDLEGNLKISVKSGDRLSVLIPFKLGNKTSEAKVELYVEREKAGFFSKKDPTVYLVFFVKTQAYGQIQWSVYLKGNQVLVQIYAEKDGEGKRTINQMIQDFEVSLRKKGFSLLAPTVILKKPFKVPTGFQLNIRG